ncbi:MAG: 50S ribosomal protein L24 [Oligoflexus sp.]
MAEKTKYQEKIRLKKGDEVVVLTGKSRGETGKIDRVDAKKLRIYVSGVNIAKRHTRPGTTSEQGGIIDKVMPVHVSNVALVDPKTKKATRVGYKLQDGKKVRYAKASGTVLS